MATRIIIQPQVFLDNLEVNGDVTFSKSLTLSGVSILSDLDSKAPLKKLQKNIFGSSYLLKPEDNGKILKYFNSSNITLGLSSSLVDVGYEVTLMQLSTGKISLSAGPTVSLNALNNATQTADLYAVATLRSIGVNEWVLSGDIIPLTSP